MVDVRIWTVVSFLILGALTVNGYYEDINRPEDDVPEGEDAKYDPVTLPVWTTLLLLGAMLGAAVLFKIDNFGEGAMVIVGIVQTFAFLGWLEGSERTNEQFLLTSSFAAVMALAVVLFHFWQREG